MRMFMRHWSIERERWQHLILIYSGGVFVKLFLRLIVEISSEFTIILVPSFWWHSIKLNCVVRCEVMNYWLRMSLWFYDKMLAYFLHKSFCDTVSTFLVQQCLPTACYGGMIFHSCPISKSQCFVLRLSVCNFYGKWNNMWLKRN